jgi:hypothetical protein
MCEQEQQLPHLTVSHPQLLRRLSFRQMRLLDLMQYLQPILTTSA